MGNTVELNYFGRDLEAMSFARNYHEWIADEFAPYFGEEVAEVGAGSGDFTEFILERGGKRVSCFEPSKNMYPILEERHRDRDEFETIQKNFWGSNLRRIASVSIRLSTSMFSSMSNATEKKWVSPTRP